MGSIITREISGICEDRSKKAAACRGGALTALDAMYHFFMLQYMFAAGSSYWAFGYGQMPGDVQKDEEGLDTMRNLGQNMAAFSTAFSSVNPPYSECPPNRPAHVQHFFRITNTFPFGGVHVGFIHFYKILLLNVNDKQRAFSSIFIHSFPFCVHFYILQIPAALQ